MERSCAEDVRALTAGLIPPGFVAPQSKVSGLVSGAAGEGELRDS